MIAALAGAATLVLLGSPGAGAGGEKRATKIVATALKGNFLTTTDLVYTPAEPHYLFVTEQWGKVQLLIDGTRPNGQPPFLDIRSIVRASDPLDPGDGGGSEQGLLAIAFAPDYATSGLFYVYFTNNNNDIEVDQFQRSASDPTVADPASRKTIIVIPHPDSQEHNGADLQFGPDGHLWLATGDGGTEGATSQSKTSLLGKVLRIDPNPTGTDPTSNYTVPPSNPFVGKPGADEIFAMGLRNPYRFSFDFKTNSLAIGDVGESSWEEIDFSRISRAKGANYGWPRFEGNHDFNLSYPIPSHYRAPMLNYPHSIGGCVITAGIVVHGTQVPSLRNRFIYGDLCRGQLRSFIPDTQRNKAIDDRALGLHINHPVAFVQGNLGAVYVASTDGTIYKLKEKR